MQPMSVDHIDLLVTAAYEYRALTSPTAAIFNPSASAVPASPDVAGRMLLEYVPAATAHSYQFRPVDQLPAIQVVKACHAYQHQVAASPSWPRSRAQRLVDLILRGATERVPGYGEASWSWTRPRARALPALGLCTSQWIPEISGVTWTEDSAELARRWDEAAIVVITSLAVKQLPTGLHPRPEVHLVVPSADLGQVWSSIEEVPAETLVSVPEGTEWLEERIRGAFTTTPVPPLHKAHLVSDHASVSPGP